MRRSRCTLIACYVLLVAGCGHRNFKIVRSVASRDFKCRKDAMSVEKTPEDTYRAAGCGKEGVYVCGLERNVPIKYFRYQNKQVCAFDPTRSPPPSAPAPPKIAHPAAAPPPGAAGFSFRSTLADAEATCGRAGHTWTPAEGGGVACSAAPDPVGFDAIVDLRFCDHGLCEVGLIHRPQGLDSDGWVNRFTALKRKLEERYGDQHETKKDVSAGCAADILPCLNGGRAAIWVTWRWADGHTITLGMGKLQGSAAIRVSYALGPRADSRL